ncbi:MAG: hypothetical protein AAFO81_14530 [Pseudomonadota bacterium]
MKNTFGESLSGPIANIVVRNWGALISLIGLMLIYAAFNPASRKLVASVAATSKFIWCGLVVIFGSQYLSTAGIVISFDFFVAVVLLLYVLASKNDAI